MEPALHSLVGIPPPRVAKLLQFNSLGAFQFSFPPLSCYDQSTCFDFLGLSLMICHLLTLQVIKKVFRSCYVFMTRDFYLV